MVGLKRRYPFVDVLLLPDACEESLEFAVAQTKTILGRRLEGRGEDAGTGSLAHAEDVDQIIQRLMEKMGPAASDYIEEVDGIGYRFKPGMAEILRSGLLQ